MIYMLIEKVGVPVAEPAIFTSTVDPKSTESMRVIKPTVRFEPTTRPKEASRRMRKRTIPVSACLAHLTGQTPSLVPILLLISTAVVVTGFVIRHLPFSLSFLPIIVLGSSLISLASVRPWIDENLGHLFVRTFFSKKLRFPLLGMFQVRSNHTRRGPAVHHNHLIAISACTAVAVLVSCRWLSSLWSIHSRRQDCRKERSFSEPRVSLSLLLL